MRGRLRAGLVLWGLLVLALHGWLGWQWQWGDWRLPALPELERLRLTLTRPWVPPSTPAPTVKRLAAAAPPARAPQAAVARPEPGIASASMESVLALPDSPLPEAEVASAEVGPEWPLSVRLRYRLVGHYQGPVHGDAEVEWLRQDDRYQVRLRVQIGPSLAPFVRRELISDGVVGAGGIRPRRYDEATRLLLGPERRVSVLIDDERVLLANGRSLPAPPGVQDSASQFVHLAWLLLTGRAAAEEGGLIELPLALPRGLHAWRYRIVGSERLETAIGYTEAWHLRPEGVAVPGALMAEVWLAPSLQYLPVRIDIRQSEQVWVQLSLREAPLQEQPEPENAASQPPGSTP